MMLMSTTSWSTHAFCINIMCYCIINFFFVTASCVVVMVGKWKISKKCVGGARGAIQYLRIQNDVFRC